MRKLTYATLASLTLTILAAGCGGKDVKDFEDSEETVAMVEAAAMEGRNAARQFATKQWKDTLELQSHLMEAKSQQSKYLIEKQPHSAAAFDSAFVSTMATVRPDLATHLRRAYR